MPVLSLETMREDEMDEVRPTGDAGSESSVLRREDERSFVERMEAVRWGSSVLDELALDVLVSFKRAPCRERGGGGGDFATDKGSLVVGVGLRSGASIECWDVMVREELLRDRLLVVEERSWLCLRARGTGGGARFCGFDTSGVSSESLECCFSGAGRCCEVSCELMCCCWGDATGVGGSGLLVSELSFGAATEGNTGSEAEKLSKDTVCGCLWVTSLP